MFCFILFFSIISSAFPAETTTAATTSETYLASLNAQRTALKAAEDAATEKGAAAQEQCQAARASYETAVAQEAQATEALTAIQLDNDAAKTARAQLTQEVQEAEKAQKAAKTAASKAGATKARAAQTLTTTKAEIEKIDAEIERVSCTAAHGSTECIGAGRAMEGAYTRPIGRRARPTVPLPTEFAACFPEEVREPTVPSLQVELYP